MSVPLSVRYGSRLKRLGWRAKGERERLALWLAPWLTGVATDTLRKRAGKLAVDWDEYGQGYLDRHQLAVCVCGEPLPTSDHDCPYDVRPDDPDGGP